MENANEILEGPRQPVRALRDQILMDGGPGTVHARRAFAAFEEFATKP